VWIKQSDIQLVPKIHLYPYTFRNAYRHPAAPACARLPPAHGASSEADHAAEERSRKPHRDSSKGYSALMLQRSPAIDDLPTHRGRCSHDCFPTIFTWMQNVF